MISVGENPSYPVGEMCSSAISYANSTYNAPLIKSVSVVQTGNTAYMCGGDGTILSYDVANLIWRTENTASNTQLNTIATDAFGKAVASGNKNSTGTSNNDIIYSNGTWVKITNTVGDFYGSEIILGTIYFVGANSKIVHSVYPPSSLIGLHASGPVGILKAITSDGSDVKIVGQVSSIFGANYSTNIITNEYFAIQMPVLNDVKWFDATHVLAVGDNGLILVSDNAGSTWRAVSSGSSENLKALDIFNANTAIVVGSNNTYFQVSFTCGSSCVYNVSALTAPSTSKDYNDISIAGGNIIVVTNTGEIYYKSGSSAYVQITSGVSTALNSVFMINSSFAYAGGNGGKLIKINPGTSATTIYVATAVGSNNVKQRLFYR